MTRWSRKDIFVAPFASSSVWFRMFTILNLPVSAVWILKTQSCLSLAIQSEITLPRLLNWERSIW